MNTSWILVANRGGARFFENTGPGKGLTLLRDIAHAEGYLKDQDFNADKSGRSFDSVGKGRHATGKSQSPTEHETQKFAKELAQILNQGRTANSYTSLVLVAEAGFLGVLNSELDEQVGKLVSQTVEKDLANVADGNIADSLGAIIKI